MPEYLMDLILALVDLHNLFHHFLLLGWSLKEQVQSLLISQTFRL